MSPWRCQCLGCCDALVGLDLSNCRVETDVASRLSDVVLAQLLDVDVLAMK